MPKENYDEFEQNILKVLQKKLPAAMLDKIYRNDIHIPELEHIQNIADSGFPLSRIDIYLRPENNDLFKMFVLDKFYEQGIDLKYRSEFNVKDINTSSFSNLIRNRIQQLPERLQENPVVLSLYQDLNEILFEVWQRTANNDIPEQLLSMSVNEIYASSELMAAMGDYADDYIQMRSKVDTAINNNGYINTYAVQTNKLTGLPLSREALDVLFRLEAGENVMLEEIQELKEMKEAYSCVSASKATIELKNREDIQYGVTKKLNEMGSAVVDGDGKVNYNGEVKANSRVDIVIGLPASGKSSVLVDPLSQEFKSRIIDNDEAKKLLPEFNQGWGAGVVHKESQLISENQLDFCRFKKENIILPKVGSDLGKMKQMLNDFHKEGYEIYLHYVEVPPNRALGRMINRFFEQGRFLDPQLAFKYDNKVNDVYEQLKEGDLINGYSKWNNDVGKGEPPILIESNFECNYVREARASRVINDNLRNDGRGRRHGHANDGGTRIKVGGEEKSFRQRSGSVSKEPVFQGRKVDKKPSILEKLKLNKNRISEHSPQKISRDDNRRESR